MLLWRPKFHQDRSYFSSNFLFAEFQWIRMSTCWIIVNLITHWSTCKPYDVTILTVVVVCSEPILSVVFQFFKRWYLWNQIGYQETVSSVHSCFLCTFRRKNRNFHFISTLKACSFIRNGFLSCAIVKFPPTVKWTHSLELLLFTIISTQYEERFATRSWNQKVQTTSKWHILVLKLFLNDWYNQVIRADLFSINKLSLNHSLHIVLTITSRLFSNMFLNLPRMAWSEHRLPLSCYMSEHKLPANREDFQFGTAPK